MKLVLVVLILFCIIPVHVVSEEMKEEKNYSQNFQVLLNRLEKGSFHEQETAQQELLLRYDELEPYILKFEKQNKLSNELVDKLQSLKEAHRNKQVQALKSLFDWEYKQVRWKDRKTSKSVKRYAQVVMQVKWLRKIQILRMTLEHSKLLFIDSNETIWRSMTPAQAPELVPLSNEFFLDMEFLLTSSEKENAKKESEAEEPKFIQRQGELSVLAALDERLFLFPDILDFTSGTEQQSIMKLMANNWFSRYSAETVIPVSSYSIRKGDLFLEVQKVQKFQEVLTIHLLMVYDHPYDAFDSWRNFWSGIFFALFYGADNQKPVRIKPVNITPIPKGQGRFLVELTFPFSEKMVKEIKENKTLDLGVWAPLYLISTEVPLGVNKRPQ